MRLSYRTLILVALAAAFIVSPGYSATITTYNNSATWQGASSNLQSINFEGLTPPNQSTYYTSPTGVTSNNVQFIGYTSSGASSIQVVDTNFSSWFNFGTNDALMLDMDRPNAGSPLPSMHLVLPAGVTSLGLNLFTVSPDALSFTITVAGSQYTVPTNNRPSTAFWGFTSDTPISSIDLTLQGTTYNGSSHALIDNFQYGMATAQTPEAATFVLIGSGLIGIVLLKKSSSRKKV